MSCFFPRKLLGFPLPPEDRPAVEEVLAGRVLRIGRILCPLVLAFQALMIGTISLRAGGPFATPRRQVYSLLYLALFVLTAVLFLAAFYRYRRSAISSRSILRLGNAYAWMLCLWSCALTVNDQLGGNGLNVYIYVVFSIAIFAVFPPWHGMVLFGASFCVLNALLPLTLSGRENLFNNLINSGFVTLLAVFLSGYLYRSQVFAAHDRMVIQRQYDEIRQANQQLHALAYTDQLTGLPNRRYLEEIIGPRLCRDGSAGLPVAGLMADIDHFKQYNDANGHQAGDRCLQQIAGLFLALADADACAVRYGGEEFFLCLFGTDEATALSLAEDLRASVEASVLAHDAAPAGHVTISVGLCALPAHGCLPLGELVRRADQALYRAKRGGRNRVAVWEKEA